MASSKQHSGKDRFLSKLRTGLHECRLGSPGKVLVALSGGTDSTALLLGLARLRDSQESELQITAGHFDHQLRRDQSEADLEYCNRLCDSIGIKLRVGTGDVRLHAAENKLSIEAAARELRYRFLADIVESDQLAGIITGHTMDDQAETVLLALTRGAGVRGASGMEFASSRHDIQIHGRPMTVFRPMLGIRRTETEQFCELSEVKPLLDETNADLTYSRNRIRSNVIPELAKINPAAVEAIARFADHARSDSSLINRIASDALNENSVENGTAFIKTAFRELPDSLKAHVIAAAYWNACGTLNDLDMPALQSATQAAAELDSGRIDLPHDVTLVVEHDLIKLLVDQHDPVCPYPDLITESELQVRDEIHFQGGGLISTREVSPPPDPASLSRWQAIVSATCVSDSRLRVRSRRPGDRFHAFGMKQEMKLQDFLVNQHVPELWRDRVPLILTERGICWVVGERIAEWAKVQPDASKAVLIEYKRPEQA